MAPEKKYLRAKRVMPVAMQTGIQCIQSLHTFKQPCRFIRLCDGVKRSFFGVAATLPLFFGEEKQSKNAAKRQKSFQKKAKHAYFYLSSGNQIPDCQRESAGRTHFVDDNIRKICIAAAEGEKPHNLSGKRTVGRSTLWKTEENSVPKV